MILKILKSTKSIVLERRSGLSQGNIFLLPSHTLVSKAKYSHFFGRWSLTCSKLLEKKRNLTLKTGQTLFPLWHFFSNHSQRDLSWVFSYVIICLSSHPLNSEQSKLRKMFCYFCSPIYLVWCMFGVATPWRLSSITKWKYNKALLNVVVWIGFDYIPQRSTHLEHIPLYGVWGDSTFKSPSGYTSDIWGHVFRREPGLTLTSSWL